MVDKDFEKITYEDDSGNVKGTFETFQFASTSPSAPFNEGYGQNLTVTRETRKEKVPNMGFRSPLKIEQDRESGLTPGLKLLSLRFKPVRINTGCYSPLSF